MWKFMNMAFISFLLSFVLSSCAAEKQIIRKKAKKFPTIQIIPKNAKNEERDTEPKDTTLSKDKGAADSIDKFSEMPEQKMRTFQREVSSYPLLTAKISKKAPQKAPKKYFKKQKSMKMHLIDVGQGTATLLEFPCGVLLIDTGGEKSSKYKSVEHLERYLKTFFKNHPRFNNTFDAVFITHSHIDHMRGLPMLLSKFHVKTLIDGGRIGDKTVAYQQNKVDAFFEKHQDALHLSIRTSDIPDDGLSNQSIDPFKCAKVDPKITILHAAMDLDPGLGENKYGKKHFDNENNHSLVTRIDFGESSILITGDLEESAIEGFLEKYDGSPLLNIDVYQVGHHGSANGSTRPLLKALSPKVALIPMGKAQTEEAWTAWKYGHPRLSIIDILQDTVRDQRIPPEDLLVASKAMQFSPVFIHRAIYGTGWDGHIVVSLNDDGDYLVTTENKKKRKKTQNKQK